MPKVDLPLYFDCRIAGVTFPNADKSSRQEIIQTLESGEELKLVRERNNRYDANAVRVMKGRKQCGYLPRKGAEIVAPLMDKRKKMHCVVTSIGQAQGNGKWGAGIRVSWKEKK